MLLKIAIIGFRGLTKKVARVTQKRRGLPPKKGEGYSKNSRVTSKKREGYSKNSRVTQNFFKIVSLEAALPGTYLMMMRILTGGRQVI